MRDPEEFEEYVVARWVGLPPARTAADRLAGGAQDLMQVTLEKVFVAWPRIRRWRPPTPTYGGHGHLAVSTGRRARNRGSSAANPRQGSAPAEQVVLDHALLWPMVCALPPGNAPSSCCALRGPLRAGDRRGLGCTAGTVKSTAHEAMKRCAAASRHPVRGRSRAMGLDLDLPETCAGVPRSTRGRSRPSSIVTADAAGARAPYGAGRSGGVPRRDRGRPVVVDPFATDRSAAGAAAPGPPGRPTCRSARPPIPYCPGNRTLRGAGTGGRGVRRHHPSRRLRPCSRATASAARRRSAPLLDSRDWSSWYPALSNDGRWAAWVTAPPRAQAGLLLAVDLAGERVPRCPGPRARVGGRDRRPGTGLLRGLRARGRHGYDLRTGETIRVTGLPTTPGPRSGSSRRRLRHSPLDPRVDSSSVSRGSSAVSRQVTADGRFTQQHEVDT